MTQTKKDPAVQGGVRCIPGEGNTPDNTTLRLKILILSHPSRLCERSTIAAVEAYIFHDAISHLDYYDEDGENAISLALGQEYRLLRFVRWWRLLPFGFWVEIDGAYVLFDRDYCPIVRIPESGPLVIVPPSERILSNEQYWFYHDETSPYCDPQTAPTILFLADDCGLEQEFDYRCALSDFGRGPYKAYAKKWKRR